MSGCHRLKSMNRNMSIIVSYIIFMHGYIILSGIDEADGNERVATLGVLVLQVYSLYAHFGSNYDVLFPRKSRR